MITIHSLSGWAPKECLPGLHMANAFEEMRFFPTTGNFSNKVCVRACVETKNNSFDLFVRVFFCTRMRRRRQRSLYPIPINFQLYHKFALVSSLLVLLFSRFFLKNVCITVYLLCVCVE